MRHKKLKLSAVLLLGLGIIGLRAQEAVTVSGGNASGNGGSASYSIGQVVYQTHTSTSGSEVQGVQQSYELSVVTAIEEAKGINLTVSTFPNPATDYLQLQVESENLKKLSYQLYDMQGKLLENKEIEGSQTRISTDNLVPAIYFLKVIQSNKEVKTFKIIKN
jgi:hypothetical protein